MKSVKKNIVIHQKTMTQRDLDVYNYGDIASFNSDVSEETQQ
jgi:hypothetical protein